MTQPRQLEVPEPRQPDVVPVPTEHKADEGTTPESGDYGSTEPSTEGEG